MGSKTIKIGGAKEVSIHEGKIVAQRLGRRRATKKHQPGATTLKTRKKVGNGTPIGTPEARQVDHTV